MRFADTSFWFGLQERRDVRHAHARALVTRGVGHVVTTNHVIGETWTLLRRRSGQAAAVGFLDRTGVLPDLEIVHVDGGGLRKTRGAGSEVDLSVSTRLSTR